jgi:hypothetical protein
VQVRDILIGCQELGDGNDETLQAILNVYKENGVHIEGWYDLDVEKIFSLQDGLNSVRKYFLSCWFYI